MIQSSLILKNLGRNKLRTILTVIAIALPMFLFTVARSFVDAVDQFLEDSDRNMRVAVHQKLTYTTSLPQRIREDIESIAPEGYVDAICRTSWFGGRLEGAQATFPSMAVDRDTFHKVYSEFGMTEEDIEAFGRERRGAVIGPSLANQMNWEIGDQVTLTGGLPPFPELDFVVVAIPPELTSPWFYFGLDYYSEVWEQQTGSARGVNNFWLKCSSPPAREWALSAIDDHFANSDHETRTEMESTFIASFTKSGGDWVGLVWTVGRMIVLVAVAVAFNTMSMSFRERTREIAVMRAVGFPSGRVTRMMLWEGLLLGVGAGAIAVLPIYILTSLVDLTVPGVGLAVRIPESTITLALGVSILTGLLAAVIPAVMAGRLVVAPALRKVV